MNEAVQFTVPLTAPAMASPRYDNGAFFPVDGQGFGNVRAGPQLSLHVRAAHQVHLQRRGDLHLHGRRRSVGVRERPLGHRPGRLHPERSRIDRSGRGSRTVRAGGRWQTYPLDLFHAERHTNASHFRVETSIQFTNCDPIIIPSSRARLRAVIQALLEVSRMKAMLRRLAASLFGSGCLLSAPAAFAEGEACFNDIDCPGGGNVCAGRGPVPGGLLLPARRTRPQARPGARPGARRPARRAAGTTTW